MAWNYRVLQYDDGTYGVHEVYYNDAGNITAHTERSFCSGDTLDEISNSIDLMKLSLEKDVLHVDTIKFDIE